jgi:HAD superfamily hydrolase (TIGR01549 family)
MTARAVLFDLFGTLVHFRAGTPAAMTGIAARQPPLSWLRVPLEHEQPALSFDAFLTVLLEVSQDLTRRRPPEFYEVPSRERFRRALTRLGVDATDGPGDLAERLSLTHMEHLASFTEMPPDHATVLETLAVHYRLGLVSNFDHAPTAHRILAMHGIARFFDTIIISDEFGRRKPHPSIFAAALARVGVPADEAVYVGDSATEDLVGAHRAGIRAVWVNAKADSLPDGVPPPCCEVRRVTELVPLMVS